MPHNALYKVPRKRKICCVVYHDKCFQSIEDLSNYLCGTDGGGLGFSTPSASKIIDNIPVVDELTMKTLLLQMEFPKTKIAKLIAGEIITAATRKRKTASKPKEESVVKTVKAKSTATKAAKPKSTKTTKTAAAAKSTKAAKTTKATKPTRAKKSAE